MRTATVFWPGDRAFAHPLHKSVLYRKDFTSEKRIDQFLEWIDEDPGLSLITLYFSLIDEVGHKYGPESVEMDAALRKLDTLMARVMRELGTRGLLDAANIVIVSDHGLLQAKRDSRIEIDRYIPELRDLIDWMDYGVVTSVFPKEGKDDFVYEILTTRAERYALPMKVYWTRNLPEEWHYKESNRIGPITILTKPGYGLSKVGDRSSGGFHGYDPSLPEMQALFIAMGPAVGQRGKAPRLLHNLDVYNLVAALLQITPNANNGTVQLIDQVL